MSVDHGSGVDGPVAARLRKMLSVNRSALMMLAEEVDRLRLELTESGGPRTGTATTPTCGSTDARKPHEVKDRSNEKEVMIGPLEAAATGREVGDMRPRIVPGEPCPTCGKLYGYFDVERRYGERDVE